VTRETPSVVSITLSATDAVALPAALPGQYLTLRLPQAGDPAPVRNYSLSGDANCGTYRISVKQELHGLASGYLSRSLQPGDTIDAAAPRGGFVLQRGTGPVLLLSAGIGVTPVLAMLHQLAAEHSAREVWWIRAARGPEDDALAAETQVLLGSLANARARLFYSAEAPQRFRGGEVVGGRLTGERLAKLGLPSAGSAYVCGPASFMADMRRALTSIGLAPADIRTELFGALDAINPGIVESTARPPHPPAGPPGTGPLITFARTGLSARFGPDGGSLLEFAESCDVPTRWSCRTGVCHTCVTPLLSGEVRYVTVPLEPPAPGDTLLCCTQPASELVLDL
jgi:ferredoxin-NADP reductase